MLVYPILSQLNLVQLPQTGLSPSGIPAKMLYELIASTMHVKCSIHHLLNLITLITYGEEYTL
jgi:hypothetical protein